MNPGIAFANPSGVHGRCWAALAAAAKKGGADMGASSSGAASSGEDPFTHELRFLLTRSETARFLEGAGGYAELTTYDPEHPIAYTRTTYFDTADAAYLTSSVDEPARRLRVR